MISLYISPRLCASKRLIASSALLVLLLQGNHDSVSAFGSFRHVWRQRACLEGGVFMVKSYLDNLSAKPSTAIVASAVTSTESDKVVSELLDLKSSLTRLTSKMSTKKTSSRQLTAEEELKARKLESSISMISGITSALLSRLEDLSASKKASGTSITTRRADKDVPSSESLEQLSRLGADTSEMGPNSYASSAVSPFTYANAAGTGSNENTVPEPLKRSDSSVSYLSDLSSKPASSGSLEGAITVQNVPSTEKESGSLRRSSSFMGSYLDSLSSKSSTSGTLDGGYGAGLGSSISDTPREIDQLSKAVSGLAALSSAAAISSESKNIQESTFKTDSGNVDKELSVDSAISIILKSLEAGEFDVETATKIGTYLKTLGIGEGSTSSLATSIVGRIPSKPADTTKSAAEERAIGASSIPIATDAMPIVSPSEKEVASQPKPKDLSSKQISYRKKAASSTLTGKSPFYSSVLSDGKGIAETKQALAVPTEDASPEVAKEIMNKEEDGSIPVNLKRAIIAGYSILGLGIVSGATLQYMTNGNPPDLATFVQGFRTNLESVININSEDVEAEISLDSSLGTILEGSGEGSVGEISGEALLEESTGDYVIDGEGESLDGTELESIDDTAADVFSVESVEETAIDTDVEQKGQPKIDTKSEDFLVESTKDSVVSTEAELINGPVEDAKPEDLSVESMGESAIGKQLEEIDTKSTEVTESETESPSVSILDSESEDLTTDLMGVPSKGTETEESSVESAEDASTEGSTVENLSTNAGEEITGKSAADAPPNDSNEEPTIHRTSEGPEPSFTEEDAIGGESETSVSKSVEDAVLEAPSNNVEPESAIDIPSKEIISEFTEPAVSGNSEGSAVLFSTGEGAVSTESDNSVLGIETFGIPVESLSETSPMEAMGGLPPKSVVGSVSTESESKILVESAVSRFLKALGSGEVTADTAAKVESAIDIFLDSFRAKDDFTTKLFPGTKPTVDSAISTFMKAMASGDVTLETATMVESAIEKFLLGYGGGEVNL